MFPVLDRGVRLASMLVLLSVACAQAQADPDRVKLRNDCRFAVQTLGQGQPAPHRAEALAIIPRCDRAESIPTIAKQWEMPVDEKTDLAVLITATRPVISPVLVDALVAELQRTGQPAEARVAALAVLLTYVDPYVAPTLDDLLVPVDSTRLVLYGVVDHPFRGTGTLPSNLPERLRAVLADLASSDPNPQVRATARTALRNRPFR
jgi:hypothetical protein